MPARACLLAVGLLSVPPGTSPAERRHQRVELALSAAASGYAVIDTFEVGEDAPQAEVALQELEAVAREVDAAAVVVAGEVELRRVHEIAERVRMVVVRA